MRKANTEKLKKKLKSKAKDIIVSKTPETRNVKYTFSDAEIAGYSRQLAEACQRRDATEAEKKSTMSSYKAKLDEQDASVALLSNRVTTGYEHRNVDCEVRKNFKTGKKEFWHAGAKVDEIVLTAQDHQLALEDANASANVNGKKKKEKVAPKTEDIEAKEDSL